MPTRKRTPNTAPPPVTLAEYSSVTPSLTDGDEVALQLDAAGNLLCNVVAGGGSGSNAAAGQTGAAVPADADYQGVNVGGTLTGVTGLSLSGKVAPTIAIVDASGNQVTAFGGSSSAIASNYHIVAAASNNAALIKGSAGTLFAVRIFNNAAYPVYVKLYNAVTNPPVPGITAVFKTLGCQAGTQRDAEIPSGGLSMGTGIGIAILKDLADSGTTAVAASDCVVDLEYT